VARKLTFEKNQCRVGMVRKAMVVKILNSQLAPEIPVHNIELTVATLYQEYAPPCASNIKQVKTLKSQLDTQYVVENFCRADF